MTDFECDGWSRILNIFPDMDFSDEIKKNPNIVSYLKDSINKFSMELDPPEEHKECPKLDDDFSKWIILNGVPICDEKKAAKLSGVIIKLFGKKNFVIEEKDIKMNWGEDGNTTGQVYIQFKNEGDAKIASSLFNGHVLDKKHTFSSCTFPDFEKKTQAKDTDDQKPTTDYL